MKSLFAVICLLTGATYLSAQTAPAKPAAPAAIVKPTTATPAPAKPGAKAKVVVKKEVEPVIPGQTITRANGTFLGLEVAGGNFKLSFYDAKKKPMSPNVTRATARWPNTRGPGDNRTVLNPSGTALVGSKTVLPPFTFTVYITLLQGEGDEAKAVESLVVPFHG